jgi:hypothetical protein
MFDIQLSVDYAYKIHTHVCPEQDVRMIINFDDLT